MKEYYTDFKGQKRRLHIRVGDYLVCDRKDLEESANIYQIARYGYDKKVKLICPFCTRNITTEFDNIEELRRLLSKNGASAYNVRQVIPKQDVWRFFKEYTNYNIVLD